MISAIVWRPGTAPSNRRLLWRRIPSSGLTMLEVLVVVIIIGVLVGVLLPAIQTSREVARRRSCENNLRQLWLATESYRFSYDVFPAGSMAEILPVENFPADNHQGWLLRIMPEVSGGANQLNGFDYSRSVYDPVNWPFKSNMLEWLTCPSDWNAWPLEEADYAGVYDGRDLPIDQNSRGALIGNTFLTDSDFADGLQHTVLLGEGGDGSVGLGWTSGTIDTLRTLGLPLKRLSSMTATRSPFISAFGWCQGDRVQSYHQFVDFAVVELSKVGALSLETPPVGELSMQQKETLLQEFDSFELSEIISAALQAKSEAMERDEAASGELNPEDLEMLDDDFASMDLFGEDMEYEDLPTYPAPLIGNARLKTAGLGSFHPSGVNVVFVDGRTQSLAWEIDRDVLASLGMRDDGKPMMRD